MVRTKRPRGDRRLMTTLTEPTDDDGRPPSRRQPRLYIIYSIAMACAHLRSEDVRTWMNSQPMWRMACESTRCATHIIVITART